MADLNNCTFTGRLTGGAELSEVGTKGTQLLKFSLANNTGFGDYAKTQYFECQMWGKQGAAIKQYMTKGKQVAVQGVLEQNNWTGNDGVQHKDWRLTVSTVTLLSGDPKAASDDGPDKEYSNF